MQPIKTGVLKNLIEVKLFAKAKARQGGRGSGSTATKLYICSCLIEILALTGQCIVFELVIPRMTTWHKVNRLIYTTFLSSDGQGFRFAGTESKTGTLLYIYRILILWPFLYT